MGLRRAELAVAGTAAALVFSRVFGLAVVLPDFRAHYAAFPVFWVGVAFGAHGLTLALAQFPMGLLSDRFGRRRILLLASSLFVVGSVAAAFADSVAALVAARLLQGLGAVASVAMAMVGEHVDATRRTSAMALVGVPAGLGFFAGVAAGPLLYPIIGMPGLFFLTAAVGGAAALPLLFLQLPAPARAGVRVLPRQGLPVASLAVGGFALNYALQTMLFFLPDSRPAALLPVLAIALVGMALLSRAIDKAGLTWQPLAVGLLALAAAAPFYGLTHGASLVAGAAFFTAHATLAAAFPSQVSRVAGARGGRGHGVQNVVAYAGTFAGGVAAGALARDPALAFALLAIVATAAALLLVRGLRSAAAHPNLPPAND